MKHSTKIEHFCNVNNKLLSRNLIFNNRCLKDFISKCRCNSRCRKINPLNWRSIQNPQFCKYNSIYEKLKQLCRVLVGGERTNNESNSHCLHLLLVND